MNLEELRSEWMAQNERFARQIRLNRELLWEVQATRGNAALGRLARRVWVGLAINLVVAVVLVRFVHHEFGEWRFVAPAVVLELVVLALIASASRQLAAISELDFGGPILTSQNKLERLRIHRILETKWTLLLAPLVWPPLLIVTLRGVLGLDAYAALPAAWLVANLLFGLAAIPLLWWVSRHFAARFHSSPVVQRMMDDVAGRNLTEARDYLARLAAAECPPSEREA